MCDVGVLRQCVMMRYGGMLRSVTVHYFHALGCVTLVCYDSALRLCVTVCCGALRRYVTDALRRCVTALRYGAFRCVTVRYVDALRCVMVVRYAALR